MCRYRLWPSAPLHWTWPGSKTHEQSFHEVMSYEWRCSLSHHWLVAQPHNEIKCWVGLSHEACTANYTPHHSWGYRCSHKDNKKVSFCCSKPPNMYTQNQHLVVVRGVRCCCDQAQTRQHEATTPISWLKPSTNQMFGCNYLTSPRYDLGRLLRHNVEKIHSNL